MARKKAEQEDVKTEAQGIDAGAALLSWESWEYPPVERSRRWYVIASILGIGLLLYALLTANFVFAVIILMFTVIELMKDLRKPSRMPIHVTTGGVVFGNDFYPYENIRDFSIVYYPPDVKTLYVSFYGLMNPTLTIPLENIDPNEVRECLLPYAFENINRDREYLTDLISRLYKI